MELGLAGKTALVTGGSKGIGLETARALVREGVKVLICARREQALAEAARRHANYPGKDREHSLDVTEVDQIPHVVREKLGRIDILVDNAGTGTYKPFLDVAEDELLEGMAIFFAQFRICQRVVPLMIAQGGGNIVNVSGETGIMTLNAPFLSSCTGQLRDPRVRPYAGALRQMGAQHGETQPQCRGCRGRNGQPIKAGMRWGSPEEIANLFVFAVSDAASYVNGAQLIADNAMDKSYAPMGE